MEPPSSSPQLLSSTGWSSTESKSGPSENSEVADLFRKLGLEKYTELFQQQEVRCHPQYDAALSFAHNSYDFVLSDRFGYVRHSR